MAGGAGQSSSTSEGDASAGTPAAPSQGPRSGRSARRRALDWFHSLSETGKVTILAAFVVGVVGLIGSISSSLITAALSNDGDSKGSGSEPSVSQSPIPTQNVDESKDAKPSGSQQAVTPTAPSNSAIDSGSGDTGASGSATDRGLDSAGESQPASPRSSCAQASKPAKVRGAAYASPCITIELNGTVSISSSFKSEYAREYTLWVWLTDEGGQPVRDTVKSCTVVFSQVGQTEHCERGDITPPHAGKWGAAVDIFTDRVNEPPIWGTQYVGAGSGSVEWQP